MNDTKSCKLHIFNLYIVRKASQSEPLNKYLLKGCFNTEKQLKLSKFKSHQNLRLAVQTSKNLLCRVAHKTITYNYQSRALVKSIEYSMKSKASICNLDPSWLRTMNDSQSKPKDKELKL